MKEFIFFSVEVPNTQASGPDSSEQVAIASVRQRAEIAVRRLLHLQGLTVARFTDSPSLVVTVGSGDRSLLEARIGGSTSENRRLDERRLRTERRVELSLRRRPWIDAVR